MIRYAVNINGVEVEAVYSELTVREIFLPLLRELTELQRIKEKRILAMLAAPPGSGKSTLLSYLESLSVSTEGITPVQTIGIDGFHHEQDYLLTHTTERDGQEIPMVKIKGAPVTFDLEKLTERVRKVKEGEVCGWPVYDRMLHNPTDNVITVTGDIVLLEGNYLLLDEDGWRELSGLADYTIFIGASEELLRDRLIQRRMKTGVSQEDSAAFVDYSDMVNVRTCLRKSMKADLVLRIDDRNDYHRMPETE